MNVIEYYEHALAERGYKPDVAQRAAIERLQRYYDDWEIYLKRGSGLFGRLFRRREAAPRGVYFWGGVGRGKSFLMDAFFETAPVERKARLHFHEFMRGVHKELEAVKGMEDPLDEVARRVADKYQLICFDEFHVSDVADAMILYRLLLKMFEYGVSFVMTSNYEPSTLYPEGLHRDRILPAIALIQERMDVMNVDTGVDYRQRELEQVQCYYTPLDEQAEASMARAFALFSQAPLQQSAVLEIEHRQLQAVRLSEDAVWFDFKTLCEGPRSQNDYLALAARFETVLLSDVPRMKARDASAARRFTWLIDVLYDHKVKLVMSAECIADELYVDGPMANEFFRTVSRIVEMQSREYLESEKRVVSAL